MKKTTKKSPMMKIVSAAAMLAVSASMLGTSTYAWFSMNTTVTATGMDLVAKSDNRFLVINTGGTFTNTNENTSATSTIDDELFPVVPNVTLTAANIGTAASWKYGYSDDPGSATVNSSGYTVCTDITEYVAHEQFSMGLFNGSGMDTADNLKLTSVNIPEDTGITVVVVCGSNIYSHAADASNITNEILATSTSKSGTVVDVYYYFDGDNTNVYTNNLSTLNSAVSPVVLTFGVD